MSWTDERIELLRKLWEKGLTASQIAEQLGDNISRNAVIGKAHRLGLKSRPSPVKPGENGNDAPQVATPVVESRAATPAEPIAESHKSVVAAAAASAPTRTATPTAGSKSDKTTLLDLSDKVCKWPIGHPGEPDFHFCGKPAQPGFPYCGEHCAVAYQAQLPRRDRVRPLPPIMPGMRPR